jgi:hypothetical protein
MAGKCKHCGFVSSDEGMVAHAGSCPAIDGQPDTMEETLHIAQQLKPKMPSFDIVESEFKPWWDKQGFIDYPSVSIKKVYRIIARHIGR